MGKGVGLRPRNVGVGTFEATPKMRLLINQVLDSGRISYGTMSKWFEERFAKAHGCKYAILSNSGTSALQISLQAMKEVNEWEDYTRVIVPATTFVATANIVIHNRMQPVFVDVDPKTYNIDVHKVHKVAQDKDVRAIIPVHLFGQAADVYSLKIILKGTNIKIIEDSCETMFVTHRDQPVGSLGDIGCFSTYVAHLLVTGVGGISTTNDRRYAAKMRSLVNHGLELEFLNVEENFAPRPMPGRRFCFDSIGHSYRITELEAALGLAQIDDMDEILKIRDRNASHLTAGLRNINKHYDNPIQTPTVMPGNKHAWMMYPIVLNKKDGECVDKEPLMKYLNQHQIETRDMLPLLSQPAYSWLNPKDFPVSDWIVKSGFYVGCHQHLVPQDIDYVNQTIESYFHKARK